MFFSETARKETHHLQACWEIP